ncbi:MAG: glycosyltransferase [Bacteroidia bacterium]|jgi:glycosyltransferase involved in cell wall biosynthesis|nr:glycosyltransferase [Bacteroidia bacterium]
MPVSIDIIITTYNRPNQVASLVSELLLQLYNGEQIILVDSSEETNTLIQSNESVTYIRTNHRNQPYQRFLGYHKAKANYVLFLDDDMEPIDATVLKQIRQSISQHPHISGIALNFKNKVITAIDQLPQTQFKSNWIKKMRWLTGYMQPQIGKLGLCGIRGTQPTTSGYTELISGGAFVAKKSHLFVNFNFTLFTLFEKKMGMGEDTIIGYCLSKQGPILYEPKLLFWHHEKHASNYAVNAKKLAEKVMYSRLYLSLEKTRLDNRHPFLVIIHYHWYALWRIVGLFFNILLKYNPTKFQMLIGMTKGYVKSTELLASNRRTAEQYWHTEMKTDLSNG